MSTRRGHNGIVYQAGLGVAKRGEPSPRQPRAAVYRAVCINTYATDDKDKNPLGYQVLCDVVLCRTLVPLYGVPVAASIGVSDACVPWVPRPTTATLSGQPLRLRQIDDRGNFVGDVTPLTDMNGDLVRVQFLEGSGEQPIIVGRSTHRQTRRLVRRGAGWSDATADQQRGSPELGEAYVRHGGTEVRVNAAGDLLVDTVAASESDAGQPSAEGGEVRVRLKRGQRLVVAAGAGGADLLVLQEDALGNVSAEVPGGFRFLKPVVGPATLDLLGATQPIVLGGPLQTALGDLVTALNTYAGALGAGAPTAPVTAGQAATAATALGLALAAFSAAVASSLSAVVRAE